MVWACESRVEIFTRPERKLTEKSVLTDEVGRGLGRLGVLAISSPQLPYLAGHLSAGCLQWQSSLCLLDSHGCCFVGTSSSNPTMRSAPTSPCLPDSSGGGGSGGSCSFSPAWSSPPSPAHPLT